MAEENGDKPAPLFDLCIIAFVPSPSLSKTVIDELKETVQQHGAEVIEYGKDGKLPVPHCTHIVANSSDFPEYTEAMAMMVPVVNTTWVHASLHRNKQAQVRPYSPDPRMIFHNVVLSCANIPVTDKEAITAAVLAMGGMESKDIGRLTTHLCALDIDDPKCEAALNKSKKCKIVLPHWFDDCFRLGKMIDEKPYLLPDPEILRSKPEDPVDFPMSQHLKGATSAVPDRPPTTANSMAGSREQLVIFKEKKVMLSWDLGMTAHLTRTISDLVKNGGGQVVTEVEDCDWFVCQYRDGEQYKRAAQQCKDVGNLAWLYHIITHNQWTDPLRRLLHYPVPKEGIPGFGGFKITLSNYGGEARIYIENLVKALGAEFTKTMRTENTHLITARKTGEKCEAAQDWNVDVVNHLWIEESYAKCEAQSVTDPRYTHFPPRTNLGEIIGQTFFDEAILREKYYPGGEEHMDASAKRKRKIREQARENGYNQVSANGVVVGRQEHQEFDIMNDDEGEYAKKTSKKFGVPAPPKALPKTKAGSKAVSTPARGRHVLPGKENDTPSVLSSSGSRSAKASALSRLQDLAPDIALYEKERRRSGKANTPFGGKRAVDLIEQEQEAARKTSPAHERSEEEDDEEVEEKRPAKRSKSSMPPVDMRIVVTSYKRWVDSPAKEDGDRKRLRQMGIQLVQETNPCDYLAAPQIIRTIKFLRTLSLGPDVINSTFLDKCLEAGERPNVEDFKLKDKVNEAKYGIKIEQSVKKARENKGRLMFGLPIYCTGDIKHGPDSYRPIAEANGAIFKVLKARSASTIKPTDPEEDEGGQEPVYLLTSNSESERGLWPKFEKMAEKGNMEPRIVAADWLLYVAMRQELEFDEKFLAKNYFKNS